MRLIFRARSKRAMHLLYYFMPKPHEYHAATKSQCFKNTVTARVFTTGGAPVIRTIIFM